MKNLIIVSLFLISLCLRAEIVQDVNRCYRFDLTEEQKEVCSMCNQLMSDAGKSLCTLERKEVYQWIENFRAGKDVHPSEYRDLLVKKRNCETHFIEVCTSQVFN